LPARRVAALNRERRDVDSGAVRSLLGPSAPFKGADVVSTVSKGERISPEDVLALWEQYSATGDQRLRDRLVLTFAPMVKYIVYKKVREIPEHLDVEDFISCGLEALIRSIDRYDPSKGATLEQFAWTRIQGAVLDELRRHDWAPRSLRRRERTISRAHKQFMASNGRRPSKQELADAAGMSVRELITALDEIAVSDVGSLNAHVATDDDSTIERIDTLPSVDVALDPQHAATISQAKDRFREAFRSLPARERHVAILLYVQHLTLREVGEILGVSESRVCQIHAQLRRDLRQTLDSDSALFAEVA
jgi:RNA polymerase sigma factor for flagellar operon FliA